MKFVVCKQDDCNFNVGHSCNKETITVSASGCESYDTKCRLCEKDGMIDPPCADNCYAM